jgi:hypothetical protein
VALGGADPGENPYWVGARNRNARAVRFGHFLKAYEPLRAVPNVGVFVGQAEAFRPFAGSGVADLRPGEDGGLLIGLGKCFSAIAYAQLVAEGCLAAGVAPPVVSVVFHALVEDLSAEALKLAAMFPPGSARRDMLKRVVRVPETSAADLGSVTELIAARYGT